MAPADVGIKRQVKERVPVAEDLEVHVSHLVVAGEKFVEVRQFVPSLKEYGRGITLPVGKVVNDVIAAMLAARK